MRKYGIILIMGAAMAFPIAGAIAAETPAVETLEATELAVGSFDAEMAFVITPAADVPEVSAVLALGDSPAADLIAASQPEANPPSYGGGSIDGTCYTGHTGVRLRTPWRTANAWEVIGNTRESATSPPRFCV